MAGTWTRTWPGAPLLAELAEEYGSRYGDAPERVLRGLVNYPAHEFDPPHGGMLVRVARLGSSDRRRLPPLRLGRQRETAELKHIWTGSRHRRKGYASLLLDALEAEIIERGYRQVYLTTGHRQPEAEALYLSRGYTRLEAPVSRRATRLTAPRSAWCPSSDLTAAGRD